jgi:glutamyl-tRNA reductase
MKDDAVISLLLVARLKSIRSLFVLSTCNRTEIYGYVADVAELVQLLLQHTNGTAEELSTSGYIKKGKDALQHLFKVACGLDSQITGDNEIVGQFRNAVELSRKHNMIGPVMDRTINFSLQASKKIRTETKISNGTVSVSYAAIEWMKQIEGIETKNIAIVGLGKFGRNVSKNIRHYFTPKSITVCNRTDQTALNFARAANVRFAPYQQLPNVVKCSDIVIVCTHAKQAVISSKIVDTSRNRVFIDLSIPANVDQTIRFVNGQQLVNVDEISARLNKTIDKRKAEIPKALLIIEYYAKEFTDWLETYQHSWHIKQLKLSLHTISSKQSCSCSDTIHEGEHLFAEKIQETVTKLAVNLKTTKEKGCQFIQAYNIFLNNLKFEK